MPKAPPSRAKKERRRGPRPASSAGQAAAPAPDEPPQGPDFEVDVAPDLVERGPDERRDRDPICSLPEAES